MCGLSGEINFDGRPADAGAVQRMTDALSREPTARVDYVSVADAATLAELQRVTGPALALPPVLFLLVFAGLQG